MSGRKQNKSLYEDISDVVFTPKKKSLVRKIFYVFILILTITIGAVYFLYSNGYTLNLPSSNDNSFALEKENRFFTVKTFSRKPCGLTNPGGEHYTDWFEIKGDIWKIKLYSERVNEGELSNVRVWYTTSQIEMLDLLNSNGDLSEYTEIGDGRPNYDSGIIDIEQETSGPGVYRLRILCWNANYDIDIQDSSI